MAETLTANYSWTKPDPGASANTWGATLNADLDKVDAQVFANQGAAAANAAPIGSITMWSGASTTPPTGWLLCDGSAVSQTTYAALYAIVGTAFNVAGVAAGQFNLPNFFNRFPIGGVGNQRGLTGGEATHVLTAAEMPSHAHGVSDPTHAHAVYDPTHAHGVSQTPHAHGVNDPSHAHGGVVVAGGTFSLGQPGWTTTGGNTATAVTGISIQAQNANVGIAAAATGIGIYGAATGVTIQNTGSSAAHNNMPPYLQIPFIIRYQ